MKYEEIPIGAGRGGRRGRGRFRAAAHEPTTPEQRSKIGAWFAGRLPDDWFTEAPVVRVDDDEILVVGRLSPVELDASVSADDRAVAERARIGGFREDTREQRVRIAAEAQQAFGRVVSWGAACGETTASFTTAGVPVMTRLGLEDRAVLDTLIDAGVARSRSEALAWCVRLVGEHEQAWITELREAFEQVAAVRAKGPGARAED
jgi:hypothetical protein